MKGGRSKDSGSYPHFITYFSNHYEMINHFLIKKFSQEDGERILASKEQKQVNRYITIIISVIISGCF